MVEDVEIPYPLPEDASQYLAQMKKVALDVLFPKKGPWHDITKYKGRHPDIYRMYLASCEWEITSAMEERRQIRWKELDPVNWLQKNITSIGGWRSEQAVRIAQASSTEHRHSLLDILRGR